MHNPRTTARRWRRAATAVVACLGLVVLAACGSSSTADTSASDGGDVDAANPTGCPSTAPSLGACSLPEGTACKYGCVTAACTQSTWSITSKPGCAAEGDGGPPPANGPFACGSATCGATQYCVNPCCGGPGPVCDPLPDSGVCPAGETPTTCPSGPGCAPPPCTPPPPYCVDDPSKVPDGCEGTGRNLACVCA